MASIYGLYDKNGSLRYIGKANDVNARVKSHMRDCVRRNTPVYAWIRKNGLPEVRILEADCLDWQEAERRLIAQARAEGVKLLNVAEGGDQPHCPVSVRQANGRKKTRNPVIWKILRDLGSNYRWLTRRGKVEKAEKQAYCMHLIRSMTPDKREAFAREWVARGH